MVIISGGSAVTLDGFTITGGNANGGPSTLGGGVLLSGGGPVVLKNVKFTCNEAECGGGLHFSHGALVMNRVEFDRNKARDGGGSIVIHAK